MNEFTRNLPLILDLQMFAEGDPEPEIDPQEPQKEPPAPKKLELTQEEFDAKIAERLSRERKKYADYDELKTKLSDFEKAEEERKKAAMSEQERLQAEKDEAVRKAQEAEESAQKALTAANQRLIKADFKAAAREAGIRADAIDDAFKLADISGVTVDDEGNVVGVSDVIAALVGAKPYLVEVKKEQPKQIGGASNHKEDKSEKTKEQLLAEAAAKAKRTGRTEDMVAYSTLKAELGK